MVCPALCPPAHRHTILYLPDFANCATIFPFASSPQANPQQISTLIFVINKISITYYKYHYFFIYLFFI